MLVGSIGLALGAVGWVVAAYLLGLLRGEQRRVTFDKVQVEVTHTAGDEDDDGAWDTIVPGPGVQQ